MMMYRKMEKSDRKLSILGFGCMRLPQTPDCHIDEPKATEMIRYAIDQGINYLDTAYVYHNGESEPFLGRALQDGYRKKVYIATKLPVWAVEKREDMDRYLNEQLTRLNTDHVDYYLLHGLMKETWNKVAEINVTEFLDTALADGRIRYAGFSFHDDVRLFKDIVDSYDWKFCQIQYNYMDEEYQAGTQGLLFAAKKRLGIVIMEPLRGGILAKETRESKKIWASAGIRRTPAEWGLRWLWNHPEITVVLSGMSTMQQVKNNLKYANDGQPNSLSNRELAQYEKIKIMYKERMKIPCTKCGYCVPCPSAVEIPECFAAYNDAFIYNDKRSAKSVYDVFTGFGGAASQCQDCGVCESLCPQKLPIRKYLEDVVRLFGH